MIPRDLARRIDRFSRRAHRFHRYAHHPLCAAYRGEVVAMGRIRICKGCLLAATGGLAGAGAGLAAPPGLSWALLAVWAAGLAVLTRWRPGKGLSRFLPAALGTFLVTQGLRSGPAGWAVALLATGALGAFWMHYRHRGPNRQACLACPEAAGPAVCSGFRPMVRREKAFRRVTGGWLR
ncbi:hypothetical protein [Mesoterricola silvestris]|uniref:DUF2085 domain-containing protein n=1 Tax=Mesoterricola silvestris TaxID=2927979 RepID=A0AA48K9T0_9BACT|nr:hypothetical protein [Mesoterricola silvestris]BDU73836.1 hypothetical protein METEAL_30100 [Mesoterricola silvestris]